MAKVELDLTPDLLERARRAAELRNSTVEAVLAEAVERALPGATQDVPVWGLFADAPELVDELTRSVERDRKLPLRASGE